MRIEIAVMLAVVFAASTAPASASTSVAYQNYGEICLGCGPSASANFQLSSSLTEQASPDLATSSGYHNYPGFRFAMVAATSVCQGEVTISEVQHAINMYLGREETGPCIDLDENGAVSPSELQRVIDSFLGK